jgi:hypothetical protein
MIKLNSLYLLNELVNSNRYFYFEKYIKHWGGSNYCMSSKSGLKHEIIGHVIQIKEINLTPCSYIIDNDLWTIVIPNTKEFIEKAKYKIKHG